MKTRPAADRERALAELLLAREVGRFLMREADLLDERRFQDWLDLLTDDVRYWMPMQRNVKFGEWEREVTRVDKDVCWFDEDKVTLEQRVKQLLTGVHWAEEPSSRVCRVVSAVDVVDAIPDVRRPTEVTAKSRFILYRNRLETETDVFVCRREDVLRKEEGRWKLARRKVLLEQDVLLAKSLTVFF